MTSHFTHFSYPNCLQVITKVFLLFAMMILSSMSTSIYAAASNSGFDHEETSFSLDFNHARVSCDACHVKGVFQGTPTQCYSCHSKTGRIQASAASPSHIDTTEDCVFKIQ